MNNRIERLAKELNGLKSQVNNMNSPQLAFSSIEDGSVNEYDNDGQLVSIIGSQPDGTHGVVIVAGPTPPAPAGATAVGGVGVIRVKWDGLFKDGAVAPLDFARIEVHISHQSGFTVEPLPNSTTRAGSIESAGGGEVALIRPAGTYYIRLITRAQSGKHSEPCGEFSVLVDPVVSQQELQGILDEVEAANADLATLQITLGSVQTDLDNAQAILDGVDNIEGRLDNLEIDVTTLDGTVANAQLAADNAVIEAQAASGLAGAAQTAANAAATAASNAAAEAGSATQAAQAAEAEVLAIAGEVAGKSTVYYGSTPPAGDPNGLWINEGKPYLWDGSNWVVSNDPDLTQAVADAAQAKTDAAAAQAKADQAALDAAAAQSAAQDAADSAGQALTASQTALGAATAAQTAADAAALDSGNAEAASAAASAAAGAAQLAADNALIAAGEASAAADQAEADAANAVTVANSALATGQNALTQANAAVGTADSALLDAQQAAADAVAAIGTANTATTAAQAAQEAADDANAEALAAAGLAGSKGEVIYQASAPTGSRAVSQNLWIRTSDNKPHTYNGSTWVAVTDKVATDAASAASSANSLAGNAWTLANTANTQANTATSLANTAQTAADTAQAAANAAQGAADDANDAALDAAGLAGSKGKVIYSATAPTGADKVAQNLWIRTTDNKPHTLVNGVWTAITDKAATDAATAAATAQSTANTATTAAATAQTKADNAWNLANTANGTANTALSTANGKNKVTYSLNAPGSAANTAGDIWFRKDSNSVIIGQWEGLGGTSWAQRTIGNTVIANLDAGKITSGFIDAARINAGTITVGMIKPGDVATPAQVSAAQTAAINAAATDAANKADAAKTAAENAAKAYADGEIDAQALATAQQASADATSKANAAQQAAIDAAKADATAKANAAQTAAINAAALDAQTKANSAKTAAELAAKQYADGSISASALATANAAAADATSKANAAQAAAISAAAADATTKANNAKAAAETAAALTAQAKADQAKADALTAAAVTAQEKADAAKAQAIASATATAATDAQTKATAAQNAAIAAAAIDATTKANNAKAGAEAAAKTYADTAISNRANLVDNPSRTGAVGRWSGVGLTVVNRTIEAITTPVLEFPSTTSSIAYSANGTDMFQIDPTKGYQISVWLEDEKALAAPGTAGTVQIYLGIHVYQGNASTLSNVTPVNLQGTPSAPSNNFYFMNATATSAPIGGMRRYVAYLMPTGTDPANMKNLGVNVSANAILGADARLGRIRVLNYNNQNTPGGRKVWIGHPSVVEVDSVALENAAKAAATADAASGTITLWKHPNATLIDGGKIYTDTITANQIAAGAITADELAANAVTATKILAGAIIAGKIATDAVTANTIAANAVTAGKINADAITAREIAADAVTASEIKAGAVVAGKIAANAVTTGTLAADSVAAGKIAADAVTAREIVALAIDTEHLKASAVVADKIAAGAIVADKIAANAITTEKIVALNITGDKIAANAISADKITANAITSDKIVANAVIADKIAANAVTADKIAANAVTADKILAGQIDVGHLAAGTLSASNITAGQINAAIGITTQGSIVAGDVMNAWSELNHRSFSAYVVNSESGAQTVTQIASIGQGESFFSSTEVDGTVKAGITPSGDIGGQNLEIANIAQVGQHLVIGEAGYDIDTHGTGEFGPVINGQALFDNQFLEHFERHPRLGATNKWFLGVPYGTVAYASNATNHDLNAVGGSAREREIIKVTFNAQSNRAYRVTLGNFTYRIRQENARQFGTRGGAVRFYRSATAGADVTAQSGAFRTAYFTQNNLGGYAFHNDEQNHVFYIAPGVEGTPVGEVTLLATVGVESDVSATFYGGQELIVEDIGRHIPNQNLNPQGLLVGSTYSGTGTPPAPVVKEYTETFTPSWTQVWNLYGIDNTYHKNMIIAGRATSDGMNMRSYVGNMTNSSGSTMIQKLSGATVVKAALYFKYRGVMTSNNVRIGLHNRHTSTATEPTRTEFTTKAVGAGQGYWLTIPSTYHSGLISGAYRGISFGRSSGAPTSERWAEIYRHDSSSTPRLKITYRK